MDECMDECMWRRERIAGGRDVQEAFVASGGPFEPAECQCDDIGDRESYGDEFEGFKGTPETFKVAQTGREEHEGQ